MRVQEKNLGSLSELSNLNRDCSETASLQMGGG